MRPAAALAALLTLIPTAAQASPDPLALTFEGAPVTALVVPAGARVRAVAARPGRTVPVWRAASRGLAAINGGYFNHSDGWPVSHVVAEGRSLTDPAANRALRANPVLAPHLPRILGQRTAWYAGPFGWAIAPWHRPPAGWRSALQAGPALLPAVGLDAEAFVIRGPGGSIARDGIGSAGRAARAALGLRPDGAMVWAVAGKPGLSIPRLAALMTRLGCDRALNLDGGGSATLAWVQAGRVHAVVGAGTPPARVNSALVWEAAP